MTCSLHYCLVPLCEHCNFNYVLLVSNEICNFESYICFRKKMSSESESEVNLEDPYRYDPSWQEHHAKAVDVQGKVLNQFRMTFIDVPTTIVADP
jgi:hypothetical protein